MSDRRALDGRSAGPRFGLRRAAETGNPIRPRTCRCAGFDSRDGLIGGELCNPNAVMRMT